MAKKPIGKKSLLAKGGGDATASGVTLQASIAASFAARLLAGTVLDNRLGLGAAKPIAIRCEAEIPVDDVAVETDVSGWVFIQSKNTLAASFVLTSELGKTFDEIARVWVLTEAGKGSRGWDRPLVYGRDAIIIAVGYATYATVKVVLAGVLNAVRSGSLATLNQAETTQLASLRILLRSALNKHGASTTIDTDAVLKFVHIVDYDFRGSERELGEQRILPLLEFPDEAPAAFKAIEHHCQNAMVSRGRLDGDSLRQRLAGDGIRLKISQKGILDSQAEIIAKLQALSAGQQDLIRAASASQAENQIVTDFAVQRLTKLRQSRFLLGINSRSICESLLAAVENGDLAAASKQARQSILAWCARILAAVDHDKADQALSVAKKLGSSEETTIAAAFVEVFSEGGNKNKALADLAPLQTPEARAASFIIAAHNVPPADAIRWLAATGLSIDELHPDAKFRILAMHLELDDTPSALDLIEKLKDADYEATPALLFFAGHACLEHVVHSDLRDALLAPLPPDLADFPLANDTQAMAHRTKAIEFYKRADAALTSLGATRAASVAADRALWLQLRDPTFADKAMDTLQSSLANEGVRLRRVPIAFAFNVGLNLQAVEDDIDRATALSGGSSADAAVARLEVALHRKALEVADYIEAHREQLLTYYQPEFLTSIEIESLCKAGRTSEARSKLTELERKDMPSNSLVTLRSLVESAAGADVVAMREAEYRKSPGVPALMNLIAELRRIRDFPKLAEFSEILFEQVKDIASAESYVGALYELHSDEKIADFASLYPEIVDASSTVGNTVAWAFYRLGCLGDAMTRLRKLKSGRDVQNDRFLETNIAIASGDWSSLGAFVESEWQKREERGPAELIRAGVLAQRIGATARSQELVRAAASKADGDAGILVTAYSTASSAGWENEEDIHGWLEAAMAASGENGPVQRMDIRDLLDGQPEWNDRLDRTWELVVQGEAPLFAAAKVASRTLLDLFLRPALTNLGQTDLRRKSPIFAFGGTKPMRNDVSKRVAVDITSLLTLGLTGQLSNFIGWADIVTIAHTTLGWLFEERDKLAFHQPSQVRRAREVKQLIDNGRLHRFEGAASDQALEMRVGDDIARYLVAVQTIDEKDRSQKLVVRPAPLPKPGSLLQESADISGLESYFAGVGDVLSSLRLVGQLSETESKNAKAYLRMHEQPWPHNPLVQPGATLYLDDVALSYLQHLSLLARLPMAGFKVYVTSSEVERANGLVGHDASADEARQIVEELQVTLRDAIASGTVRLGRLLEGEEEGGKLDMHPSRLLLSDRPEVETLVIDDRFINRFATHETYAIASSVDLLGTMAADGALTADQLVQAITVIRQAGLLFTPFCDGEVASLLNSAPIIDGRIQETAELKAMRDSVLLARMTDGLQLPRESVWIDSLLREVLAALRNQWQDAVADDVASVRSSWLLQFLDPRGWSHRSTAAGANAADRQRAQILALLIMPTSDEAVRLRYWNWLEEAVLAGFREEQPESYAELVKTVRQIVEERVVITLSEGSDGEQS
ncbi:hypothetical protein GOZ81_13570 [Agrobacterium vitis]|uniref:HTH domain-containing protein n=1 Tax=Agrobacterium vitis TaxID=373 RepID=UPI0012E7B6FE|nr:hypothetical protein [Agrobacterium vitis]MVA72099.1 hypothetical protein [Agrobacterium vitis]